MLTRSSLTIRLHPNDDVVIARAQLVGGTNLLDEKITVSGLVPHLAYHGGQIAILKKLVG